MTTDLGAECDDEHLLNAAAVPTAQPAASGIALSAGNNSDDACDARALLLQKPAVPEVGGDDAQPENHCNDARSDASDATTVPGLPNAVDAPAINIAGAIIIDGAPSAGGVASLREPAADVHLPSCHAQIAGELAGDPHPQTSSGAQGAPAGLLSGPKNDDEDRPASGSTPAAASPPVPEMFTVNPDRNKNIVTNLGEMLEFHRDCYARMTDEDAHLCADAMDGDSLSCAFSGIDAAGTASNINHYFLQERTGRKIRRPPLLWHIEWDKHCQTEGLEYCKAHNICWFDDISQFFKPELRKPGGAIEQVLQHPHLAVEILAGLIAQKQAMVTTGNCLVHNKKCKLLPSKRHIGGSSCTPYARRGVKLGLSDPNILYTMAWLGILLELDIADITSENVPDDLLSDLFHRFFGKDWILDRCIMDPPSFGYPYGRGRSYLRARHKVKVYAETSPLSAFSKMFFRAVKFEWQQLWFLMHPDCSHLATIADEPQKEIGLAQQKEQSSAKAEPPLSPTDTDAFYRVLHPTEQEHVVSYHRRWPGQAWQLHQDPLSGQESKSTDWAMQVDLRLTL